MLMCFTGVTGVVAGESGTGPFMGVVGGVCILLASSLAAEENLWSAAYLYTKITLNGLYFRVGVSLLNCLFKRV